MKVKSEQRLTLLVNLWRRVSKLPLCVSCLNDLNASSVLIKGVAVSSKAIIAGNGPSFSLLQSSIADLRDVDIITSNYAYRSSSYHLLSPRLHFIIDPKIANGIWPLGMIDEVLEASPSTVVVLDIRWKLMSKFHRFWRNPRIAWILPIYIPSYYSSPTKCGFYSGFHGLNVTACAFSLALTIGYESLGFIGVEADGLFREILDKPSHFYQESCKDQSMSSYEAMVDSLHLSTYSLFAWSGFVKSVEAQGVKISNLSDQGIFDVCKRQSINDFVSS